MPKRFLKKLDFSLINNLKTSVHFLPTKFEKNINPKNEEPCLYCVLVLASVAGHFSRIVKAMKCQMIGNCAVITSLEWQVPSDALSTLISRRMQIHKGVMGRKERGIALSLTEP